MRRPVYTRMATTPHHSNADPGINRWLALHVRCAGMLMSLTAAAPDRSPPAAARVSADGLAVGHRGSAEAR